MILFFFVVISSNYAKSIRNKNGQKPGHFYKFQNSPGRKFWVEEEDMFREKKTYVSLNVAHLGRKRIVHCFCEES